MSRHMNEHERRAWRQLINLGAKVSPLAKPMLSIVPIRITSERKLRIFASALVEVVGRSGVNRRHMDRSGCLVYIVTDDPNPPKS
jgi:hypothetical protein